MVPEAYRQKFRNCKKENEQTHVEFARTKEQLFDRWCSSKKTGSDHEKLRQLMLVEEFKRCINSDIKSFLDEKQVETLEAAARLADDYALTHKVSFIKSNPSRRPFFPQSGSKHSPSNPSGNYSQTFTPKPKSSGENNDQNPLSQPICNYCKKTGHIISECLHLKRKKEKQEGLNLLALPLYGQTHSHVLRRKILSRPKGLRLTLLWRFMNHSYQMVLCHRIVTMPSLPQLKSYEIPELLNPLF